MNRVELKRLINSGSWLDIGRVFGFEPKWVRVGGSRMFDWTSCNAAFWAVYGVSHREVEPEASCIVPHNRITQPRVKKKRARTYNVEAGRLQRFEHFGDAIVAVAARILANEIHSAEDGKSNRQYFSLVSSLVTNQNFATYPGIRKADRFEEIIGQDFDENGIEMALETAMDMLRMTKAYPTTHPDALTGEGEL